LISYSEEGQRFNFRVAAIIIVDDSVLLQTAEGEGFWTLPGGRCELMETSQEALIREMKEELDIKVEIGNLVWIVENFFGFDTELWHEIGLYYTVNLPDSTPFLSLKEFSCEDTGLEILFRWFNLEDIVKIKLYPSFLKDRLKDIPAIPTHLVHRDGVLESAS
jgi:ADP-ribose pyrophosphatase YjhB (NUDIX family)